LSVLPILGFAYPNFDTNGAGHRPCLGETVVDIGPQRVQRNFAIFVLFGTCQLSAVQTACTTDTDAFSAEIHGSLDRALHCTTEIDPAFELLSDVLRHQLRIHLGIADLADVEVNLFPLAQLADFAFQPLDLGAFATDHETRPA